MTGTSGLNGIYGLLACFIGHGVGNDLAARCLAERWGVYRVLSNMAGS
jgi:hypothetical protein